ncbi:DUF3473 domain-containing protein [candidate division KSB1 bacterium]|nr:DUF3473 domain-containing protein [candidate division KSB1 bacterium]NIX71911.1 DUF3473 domain-containing protein [candidate division KSB1 bacterium]
MNLLTFDIEDWYHPNLAEIGSAKDIEPEDRVVEPTLRIIKMLERTNNKATFFVLGEVAEKFPELVQEMIRKGHEVASHGYRHNLVYNYTKYQFETDIEQSVEILEKAINQKVIGYRAPSWSLNRSTTWAWKVLHSFGFKYDSSLYPFKTFLYGDDTSPRFDYTIQIEDGKTLKEIPPSAVEVFGSRMPFAGGFFLRVTPLWYVRWCISHYNKQGKPAVIYLHPWEIDLEQPRLALSAKERFIMYANLRNTERKLFQIMKKYDFTSIRDYFAFDRDSKKTKTAKFMGQETA